MSEWICLKCEARLDDSEIKEKKSWLAEDYYETIGVCPHCGNDEFAEAKYCKECGEWKPEDEFFDDVCKSCQEDLIAEYRHNPEKVYFATIDDTDKIEISTFLKTMFSTVEIERILLNKLKETGADCEKYIDIDREFFLEHIIQKGGAKE